MSLRRSLLHSGEAELRLGTSGRELGLNLGAEGGPKRSQSESSQGADSPSAFSKVSHSEDETN